MRTTPLRWRSVAAALMALTTACAGFALAPSAALADDVQTDVERQLAELDHTLVDDYRAANHETDLTPGNGGMRLLANDSEPKYVVRQDDVIAELRKNGRNELVAVITGITGKKHVDIPSRITLEPWARAATGKETAPVVRIGDGQPIKGDPESVNIPSGVEIGNRAFRSKENLKRVKLTFGVQVDAMAFAETPNLAFVDFPLDGGEPQGPNDLLTLADAAFAKTGTNVFSAYMLHIWGDRNQADETPKNSQYVFGATGINHQFYASNIMLIEHQRPQEGGMRAVQECDPPLNVPGKSTAFNREAVTYTNHRIMLTLDYRTFQHSDNVTATSYGVNDDQVRVDDLIVQIRRDTDRDTAYVIGFVDDGGHTMSIPAAITPPQGAPLAVRVGYGMPLQVIPGDGVADAKITKVVAGEDVEFANQAFRGNTDLKEVTLGAGTICGYLAFAETPNLKKVTFPEDAGGGQRQMLDIKEGAFYQTGSKALVTKSHLDIWTSEPGLPTQFPGDPWHPFHENVSALRVTGARVFEGSNIVVRAYRAPNATPTTGPDVKTMKPVWTYSA